MEPTADVLPEENAVDNQPDEGDDQDGDVTPESDNQDEPKGLTDALPEKDNEHKKTVKGFQKALEKKNKRIEEIDSKIERLESQNLELAFRAVSADLSTFDTLDPVTQDKVAKKMGYDGVVDFVRSNTSAPAEKEKPKEEPAWFETHRAFTKLNGEELKQNPELNQLLGYAFNEFKELPADSQTPTIYKKVMKDAQENYEAGKKAKKTMAEILGQVKQQVVPTTKAQVNIPPKTREQKEIEERENAYLETLPKWLQPKK